VGDLTDRFDTRRWDASEQIALEIRRYLEHGDLRPGDRLGTEADLAAEFGVSRPTLREALRLVAGSHLIRATQGRNGGIFVASTPNEGMSRNVSDSVASMLASDAVSIDELLEARVFLESPLAGRAAERHGPRTVAELEAAVAASEGLEPGSEAFNAADKRFHQALADAAGNDLVRAFTSWTIDVLQPHLAREIGPRLRRADIVAQHRAILRAVARGQRAGAEAAMRAHLEHVRGVFAAHRPTTDDPPTA
jgi:GntR family transcriptional regulator, transcriptional repressor for pyruvate dehydrogenase complex